MKPRKPRKATPLRRARALARSTWKQPRSRLAGISRRAFDAPHFGVEPWETVRLCLASLALDGYPAR